MGKRPNASQQNRRRKKRGLRVKDVFGVKARKQEYAKAFPLRHVHPDMLLVQSSFEISP